jgi:hypothetical protein
MKTAVAFGAQVCVVLKPGHFGKNINNTWEFFEMWYWKRKEISWTDRVRKDEMLQRVKEKRNIVHTQKRSKAN